MFYRLRDFLVRSNFAPQTGVNCHLLWQALSSEFVDSPCQLPYMVHRCLLLERGWAIVYVRNAAIPLNASIVCFGGLEDLVTLSHICHAFVQPLWDFAQNLVMLIDLCIDKFLLLHLRVILRRLRRLCVDHVQSSMF